MSAYRMFRRRCAFRYFFAIFVFILICMLANMTIFSGRTFSMLQSNKFAIQGMNDENMDLFRWQLKHNVTKATLEKFINSSTLDNIRNKHLGRKDALNSKLTLTWEDCRSNPKLKTGNVLIDTYGQNDPSKKGEMGVPVVFEGKDKMTAEALIATYHLNVFASDKIPLNRMVPDARFEGCKTIPFRTDLPSVSIIIPFYDEWPSILLRTIYSIINRSPWNLIKEIILVDDGSSMKELKEDLDKYLASHFPSGLIKMIRQTQRKGLIQARLTGFRNSTGEVIIFFDSHMEVNIDWLQPLLTEVRKDRHTIAMGTLDYVQLDTMEYKFYGDYMTRYGFDWRLVFFETFFRNDQVGQTKEDIRPGTVMVGAAYAIDRTFFQEMGTYDEGMTVWGGENLEMAWRMWLCGGRLIHVPCSHIGHVARSQPYTFPGGRDAVEQYNYKRAIEVWMEDEHKELIYNYFPNMKDLDVGDLSERFALKKRLNCKPFSWFMENIWQELFVLTKNVTAWGSARNLDSNRCLDNHQYLFQAADPLYTEPCHYQLASQGFSMTNDKLLRTSLQCVVVKDPQIVGSRPKLEDCIIGPKDTWTHKQGSYILHEKSGLCLDLDAIGPLMNICNVTGSFIQHDKSGLCLDLDDTGPVMNTCNGSVITQVWQFNSYNPSL